MDDLERVVMGSPQRFATPEGRVALGRFFLLSGADAQEGARPLLRRRPSSSSPTLIDAYLATAELALAKQDYALAAETLRKAPKAAAEDPRFHYLLARAYSAEDRAGSDQGAGRGPQDQPAPRRQPAAPGRPPDRFRAVRRGRAGPQAGARRQSRTSRGPGPTGPCWPTCAATATAKPPRAGRPWRNGPTNPEVDHLIGRKLSQKYRFAEGSAYQQTGARVRPRLPARQDPALPGPAPARRRGRGLEARCRDLRQRWL